MLNLPLFTRDGLVGMSGPGMPAEKTVVVFAVSILEEGDFRADAARLKGTLVPGMERRTRSLQR